MHGGSGNGVAVVVDDEVDVRELLQQILESAGFDVVTAENGTEALEAIRAHDPSLVTLDLSMPGSDGFAVLQQIRALSSAYVVIVTVSGNEIDLLQGLEAGADGYVVKPLRPREFRARVEALLRRPRALDRPAAPGAPHSPAPPPVPEATAPAPVIAPEPALPPEPAPSPEPWPAAAHAPGPTPDEPPPPAQAPPPPPPPPPAQADAEAQTSPQPTPTRDAPAVPPAGDQHWERFRGLALNRGARLVAIDGLPVELDADQFDLLVSLIDSGRRLRTRSELSAVLHGRPGHRLPHLSDQDRQAVDDAMGELLAALGEDAEKPRWIERVPGVGYRRVET
ncbi:MAG TPA: response regulator transcription factor [Marmoricola sp.]